MPGIGDKPLVGGGRGKLADRNAPIIQEGAPEETVAKELPKDWVHVKVTKPGDGKVSKGEIDMSENATYTDENGSLARIQPFPYHRKGETLAVHRKIADQLEDRGFVEIQGEDDDE